MAVVDFNEQKRRERAAGGTLTMLMGAFLLGLPFIGWLGAFGMACQAAYQAYTRSSNRLADISIALGGLIPYGLIAWATMGSISEHMFRMWLAVGLYSLAWLWLMRARFGFGSG